MRLLIVLIFLYLPILGPSKGPKTAMDSFRYELYENGGTTVYYIHKTDAGTSLYYREAGSLEGWRLSSVPDGTMDALAKIWKKSKLADREKQSLDNEDKSRDRWIVEATFGGDTKHTIIEYSDSGRGEDAIALETAVVSCVRSIIEKQRSAPKCPFSKCIYSEDGHLIKRVDYDSEGKICGGYDALDPFAKF